MGNQFGRLVGLLLCKMFIFCVFHQASIYLIWFNLSSALRYATPSPNKDDKAPPTLKAAAASCFSGLVLVGSWCRQNDQQQPKLLQIKLYCEAQAKVKARIGH